MKNMLRTLVFISLIRISFAQVTFHFPHTEATWGQFNGVYYDSPFGSDYYIGSSNQYVAGGDSLLNGYTYIKMYSADAAGNIFNMPPRLIREEGDKVYYFFANIDNDTLLYDFSLQPGNVAQVYSDYPNYSLMVDSIGQIMIANELRKCIYFSEPSGYAVFDQTNYFSDNHDPVVWMEGIGSNDGLFSPGGGWNIVDGIGFLTCFKEHDSLKYGIECNLIYNGDKMPEANSYFEIFPNPTSGKISINNNNVKARETELILYSSTGKRIWSQLMTASGSMPESVDLATFPNGLYLMQVRSSEINLMEKVQLIK
ncbi:MAG: T9SS type A sorting domain-containing protein [Chitinophagaceae bacterium]|nr:T9SS type A sorting domain-containing protein [Chitinophagaceae bacterium]